MGTFGIIVAVIAIGFFALTMGMQLVLRSRVAALKGTAVPDLPGGVGERISAAKHALVYFYSPQCGACRAITPRVRELGKHNSAEHEVFAIDVMQDMPVAQALKVMATPSTVEIEAGKIVGYHIGPIPDAVLARFA
jgi:thiol-disulfide isomerase/thioredoxin